MSREAVQIPFKNKVITLIFDEFEDEIDIDRLTFIDYQNLHAEFLTISTLYNRVGLWKAEAEKKYDSTRLNRKIKEAQVGELKRKELKTVTTDSKGGQKIKWPTISEVENAVTLDPEVQNLIKREIRHKRDAAYMDSLFWAIKSKEKKLDKLIEGAGLKPEDFEHEIVEGKWNGILIKCQDKLIKG